MGNPRLIDKKTFRRRVILRIAGHPLTTWSAVASAAAVTVAMIGNDQAIPLFVAVVAGLVSVGTAAFNLIYRSQKIGEETIENIQREERAKVSTRLDDLERKLEEDADKRDDEALRDLRALVEAFKDEHSIINELDVTTATDILARVDRLFWECVNALERSLKNLEIISRLSREASNPLCDAREEVIAQVQQGVKELGNILTGAQKLVASKRSGDGTAQAIASETAELRQTLELARKVEERMRGVGGERNYDEYLAQQ